MRSRGGENQFESSPLEVGGPVQRQQTTKMPVDLGVERQTAVRTLHLDVSGRVYIQTVLPDNHTIGARVDRRERNLGRSLGAKGADKRTLTARGVAGVPVLRLHERAHPLAHH